MAMSLITPESIQKLQTALHAKAKGSADFRLYALYDKVYREDILVFAYACCKANGGAAGVDHQRFKDIEAYGEDRWLNELAQELKNRTYQPLPVRRVHIPKSDGKTQRPPWVLHYPCLTLDRADIVNLGNPSSHKIAEVGRALLRPPLQRSSCTRLFQI
jgi:hypothetical protein